MAVVDRRDSDQMRGRWLGVTDLSTKEANATLLRIDHVDREHAYCAPFCHIEGACVASFQIVPDTIYWVLTATLATDTSLTWSDAHGDEVVYILTGEVEVGGSRCGG